MEGPGARQPGAPRPTAPRARASQGMRFFPIDSFLQGPGNHSTHFLDREILGGDSAVSINYVIRRSAFHVEESYDLPILPVSDLRPSDALVFDHRLKRFRVIIK